MIGGNAALDFVNTVSHWTETPADRLDGVEEFAIWAVVAGLIDEEDQARLVGEIARDRKMMDRFYQSARRLRGALWRIFSAVAAGEQTDKEDLATLNEWKVRSARHSQIVYQGDGFRRRCTQEAPALERALRMIVEAAEELLLNGRLDRLHTCGGGDCEWMFLDLSKNGRRRWCSMATCGNDAKVKKFRKRKKSEAA